MGLISNLTGQNGGDDPDDDGPDHYRVCHTTPKGGWVPVEGYEELAEPIEKDTFRWNAAPLEHSEYRLFAVKGGLNQKPPEGVGWVLENDNTARDTRDDVEKKLDRLEQQLTQQQQGQTVDDPNELVDQAQAAFQLKLLNDPTFLARNGEALGRAMFGIDDNSGSDGPDYDDWQENPFGAALFSTAQAVKDDPHKIQDVGEALGGSVGSFLNGAAGGIAPQPNQQPDQQANQQPTQEPTDEPAQEPTDEPASSIDVDGGPADPSDLIPSTEIDDNQLVETVASARRTQRQTEQLRREGPGTESGAGSIDDHDRQRDHDADDADGQGHPTDALVEDDDGPPPERRDPEEFGQEFDQDDSDDLDGTIDDTDATANGHSSAAEIAEGL